MNTLGFLDYKTTLKYIFALIALFFITLKLPFPADIYLHMGVMLWVALRGDIVFSNITSLLVILFILIQNAIHPYQVRYLFIALSFITLLQIFVNLLIIRQKTTNNKLSETEEALKSEIKLRKIFEESLLKIRVSDLALLHTIPLAVLVYSIDGNQRFYHNQAALQLFHEDNDTMPPTIDHLYALSIVDHSEIIQKIHDFSHTDKIELPPFEHRLNINQTTLHIKSQIRRIDYENNNALLIMLTDITESKEAEFALRVSETNHRLIVEGSQSAILVISYSGLNILYQNPGWNRIIEQSNIMLLDDIKEKILISELEDDYQAIMDTFFQTSSAQGETRLRTMIGREITIVYDIKPILYHGVEAALLMIYDITEAREAQILKAQLEHERKIRLLRDEFVTLMSHEFRTPLAIIKSAIDISLKYADHLTQEQQIYHHRNVLNQVNNMVSMVDNILLLSRANVDMLEFEPKHFDLAQYIKDVITELNHVLDSPHPISYVIDGDFKDAYFDPHLIRNILYHLLNNAIRYSDPESEIKVEVARHHTNALISITDYGIGIPPDAPDIFEPFIRVPNTSIPNGPGLGLAVVQSSAKCHGGNITYISSPNHTVFIVNIPINGTNQDIDTSNSQNDLHSVI